ncbi:hypothetical protein L9F63_010059 [Diploptera punctata]|uniref:Mitochondrial 2-oxoglutarate/malate carrier protein n=1 Tax=Diploptera punctata TaxID=6984 RepID=A0AAD8ERK2_DIPPU|nr:hypothetical protein L9F63_010059 [Diploptera punctata]
MASNVQPKPVPKHIRFILGGLAGIGAVTVCHPLDFLKTRMQLRTEGTVATEHTTFIHMAKTVILTEGPLHLFDGLSAAVMRQIFYTSARTGIFTSLNDIYSKDGQPPTIIQRLGIGVVTGVVGTFFGVPFDVALIRMSADGRLPPEERRNYHHVGDAFYRIITEEGILTLWRGIIPTMCRAVVVSTSAFVTYLQTKEFFIRRGYMQDNFSNHFVSSMISGLVTTITSLPFDAIKTRLQNMKIKDGKAEYAGMLDATTKIITKEGVSSLFRGFTPYYLRQGPFTILYFVMLEFITKEYRRFVLGDMSGAGL